MLELETPMDFTAHVGESLGATQWEEITQARIDAFAELTGDDHWIHVDQERAAREQPEGKTIAHGLFLLSLVPHMQRQLFRVTRRGVGLNYGYDRIRFTAPVMCGAFIRLRQDLIAAEPQGNGVRIELKSTFEIKGKERPALVAHGIILIAMPA